MNFQGKSILEGKYKKGKVKNMASLVEEESNWSGVSQGDNRRR